MKNTELEILIKGIVRQIVNEYVSLSSSDIKKIVDTNPSLDSTIPPDDAQTPAEKARMEREAELARQKDIKQKQSELDSKKKEMELNKKKLDQQKRFEIPTLSKDIQKLKGATLSEDGSDSMALSRLRAGDSQNFYYLNGRPVGTITVNPTTQISSFAPLVSGAILGKTAKSFGTLEIAEDWLVSKLNAAGLPISNVVDIDAIPPKPDKFSDISGSEIK